MEIATVINKNGGGLAAGMRRLAIVFIAIAFVFGPTSPAASEETTGIAGGPNFPAGVEIPFVAGIESSVQSSFFIQNLSSRPIELAISHGAPKGVLIEPSEGQSTVFSPGESAELSFDITVTEPAVPGSYRTSINVTEANPELPEGGGSLYVPAITGEVVIEVVGASAFAKLSSVSELTGLPAVGDLSLIYVSASGAEIRINETRGSVIESPLVPGDYKFTFDVPGLQRQDFQFSVSKDDQLDLVFEIPTLEFLETAAIPARDERDYIQSVALTIDVFNNLGQIDEQIFFQARISKDGALVEEFVVGALPNLPQAGSVLKANYLREEGFEQGDWEFAFEVVGDNFALSAEEVVVINSPGIFQSYLQEIIIAVGALVIIGLLIPNRWWALILRRARVAPKVSTKRKPPADSPNETKVLEDSNIAKPKRETVKPSAPRTVVAENALEPKVKGRTEKTNGLSKVSKGLMSWNPLARKQVSNDSLQEILQIRRKLETMADQGVRSAAVSYKIDSVFVGDKDAVINRSTGEPYSEAQLKAIREFERLEQKLQQIETPELRVKVMMALVSERLQRGSGQPEK